MACGENALGENNPITTIASKRQILKNPVSSWSAFFCRCYGRLGHETLSTASKNKVLSVRKSQRNFMRSAI